MALTVYEGFKALLERIRPSEKEVGQRSTHRRTIEQAMTAEFKSFNELLVIGSHTRDSAIHVHSDIDYFAKLGVGDVMRGGARVSSSTVLDRAKRALNSRFPNTQIRIDGPAVVVGFGQGKGSVDLVPGVWTGTTSSSPHYPVFEIPDGVGGWFPTSPGRHTKYLRDADKLSGYKLSGTIQLLKAWKYVREPRIPVLGFHLEMLLAANDTCRGVKSYQHCLLGAFRLLRDRRGAALTDPVGVSGWIPAATTEAKRFELVEHASYAVDKTLRAIAAELVGKVDVAFDYWNLVFNGEFPARR